MFKQWNRLTATLTLGVFLAGSLFISAAPAQANSSTWKKVALGAAAVAGYGALKGKKSLAIGGAAVAAAAYLKAKNDREQELRDARYRDSRYRNSRYRDSRYGNSDYRKSSYRSSHNRKKQCRDDDD